MKHLPKLLSFLLVMVMLAGSVVVLDQSTGTARAESVYYIDTDFDSGTAEGWWKISGGTPTVSTAYHSGPNSILIGSLAVYNCTALLASYYADFWFNVPMTDGYTDYFWKERVLNGTSYQTGNNAIELSVDGSKRVCYIGSGGSSTPTGWTIQPDTWFHHMQIWKNGSTFDLQLDENAKKTGLTSGYTTSYNGITAIQAGGSSNTVYLDNVLLSAETASSPAWSPAFTSTPGTTGQVGSSYSYTPTTNETATITAPTLPAWATYSGGIISGTPSAAGTYAFHVHAVSTAGTLASDQYWNVTVSAAPSLWGPSFTSTPPDTVEFGDTYTYAPVCNETVTFAIESFPAWAGLVDGSVIGLPNAVGSYDLSLKATSTAGTLSSWQNWTVTVEDTTPIPAFLTSPVSNASKRVWYSYQPLADMDCTWSVNSSVGWIVINQYTGQVFGLPTSPGTFHIVITATSTEYGTTATQAYDLTVADYITPPNDDVGDGGNDGGDDSGGGQSTIDIPESYLLTGLVIVAAFFVVIALVARRH